MLTTTLPSYAYRQYLDDDDIQAFVVAQNAATQTYIDWFNQVFLPYYPGLTGPLLDWVVEGLYGLTRTQLASPTSAAKGMYNTVPYNTLVYNGYAPSTQTFYDTTDDLFQRILTWDFFKGDGKRFSTRWLKRRIMRFLVGTNGIDPQPDQTGFTVGAETTSAIGVHIASGTLTVSIDQTLLSFQADIDPTILTLFQLAFQGGNLDLPVAYAYAVNIVTGFDALARPNNLVSDGPAFSQTTGITGVVALGGTGIYTYAWTWQSGGTGITINSPASPNTSFTAAGLVWGETVTGIARCTVTDTVSSLTAIATCGVTLICEMPSQILIEGGMTPLLTEGGSVLVVEP